MNDSYHENHQTVMMNTFGHEALIIKHESELNNKGYGLGHGYINEAIVEFKRRVEKNRNGIPGVFHITFQNVFLLRHSNIEHDNAKVLFFPDLVFKIIHDPSNSIYSHKHSLNLNT